MDPGPLVAGMDGEPGRARTMACVNGCRAHPRRGKKQAARASAFVRWQVHRLLSHSRAVPAIYVLLARRRRKTWIPGTNVDKRGRA